MAGSGFLERFLSNEQNRAAALEFMQAVASDRSGRLRLRSAGESDPLNTLITEALKAPQSHGTIAIFLSDHGRRAFAKMFILFLVSSFRTPFQPNDRDGWEPFQPLIDELTEEGLMYSLADAAPVETSTSEFLLCDAGGEYLSEILASFEV